MIHNNKESVMGKSEAGVCKERNKQMLDAEVGVSLVFLGNRRKFFVDGKEACRGKE